LLGSRHHEFFSVILSEARDLVLVTSGDEVLRFAQDDRMQYPTSIKGVVIHDGCVLLLLNERGEWDLPGGRLDPGEDHRAALTREVREEAGLAVEVGAQVDEHLFEVLPQRFVRIVAYACELVGARDVVLSHEHLDTRWVRLADLAETIDGHPLPKGYLGAIRQAIDQPRSPSERVV
jgi:8-oxo-dGTP pyrophosphatase MutT (NUDIX family)